MGLGDAWLEAGRQFGYLNGCALDAQLRGLAATCASIATWTIGQPGATSAVASRLSTTTTMSDPPPPPPTQRKSRVLAALDNPAFFSQNPTTTSLARTLPPLSSGLATPIKQRLDTPAPFNVSTTLGLAGVGSSQKKRKVSGPENDYDYPQASGSTPGRDREFGLNYDQETPVRSIDRGGDDQATKYVCSFWHCLRR